MWLDKPYSVDVDLISVITGLQRAGTDTVSILGKDKDPALITKVKNKYDLDRANRGFLVSSINDPAVRLAIMILSCKVLQTSRPN